MFAFLIWDTQERVLFGARDWFGIKPLYTYTDERGTFFASEKKSLLDVAGRGGRRRARHHGAAALPDPAVRARAGVACTPAIRRDRVRHLLHAAPGRAGRSPQRYFHPDFADQAGGRRRASCTAQIAEALRGLGRQAHAGRRHGRLVPVRRHRLDRDRRAGQAAQPEPAHLHHRLRARGLLRDRRRRRVGGRDRRRAHHQGRHRRRR